MKTLGWVLRCLWLRLTRAAGPVFGMEAPGRVLVAGRCRDCQRFYCWEDVEPERCTGCEYAPAGLACEGCGGTGWATIFPPDLCEPCRIAWGYY